MDMQGSKIAITLPTGQVVEYELMRIGTVAEYRELVKVNDEIAGARDAALAGVDEIARQRDEVKACLAEMTRQRDTALKTIAELQRQNEMREEHQFRDTGLLEKLEADKCALESLMAEIMGTIGQLRED